MTKAHFAIVLLLAACGGGGDDTPEPPAMVPQPVLPFEPTVQADSTRACAPEGGVFSITRFVGQDPDGRQRAVVDAQCNDGRVHYLNYRLDGTLFEHFVGPFGSAQTTPVPL